MSSKKQWKKAYKLLIKETNMLHKELKCAQGLIAFLEFKSEEEAPKKRWCFFK